MKANFVVILVTCASREEARSISDSLLTKRLIACANIVTGIESKFWWRGRIDNAKEVLMLIKAKAGNFKIIEKEIKRIHSYEVAEIIALPIIKGSKDYLKWIQGM